LNTKVDNEAISNFAHKFTLEQTLGSGDYSHVYSVTCEGKSYALKVFKYHIGKNQEKLVNEIYELNVKTEHDNRKKLGEHPNLVWIYGWERARVTMTKYIHAAIQMELCLGGTLKDIISKQSISETNVHKMLVEISSGLEHIHSHKFIHCDVKPENIFLSEKLCDTTVPTFKLGDFGLLISESEARKKAETLSGLSEISGDGAYIPDGFLSKPMSYWDVYALGLSTVQCMLPLEPSNGKKEIPKALDDVNFSIQMKKLVKRMLDMTAQMSSKDVHNSLSEMRIGTV